MFTKFLVNITASYIKPTCGRRVDISAEPACWLRGRKAVDELVGGAALVLGHILQMDSLLQKDLPLDTGPIVPLNGIDHLDKEENGKNVTNLVDACNWDQLFQIRMCLWRLKKCQKLPTEHFLFFVLKEV